MERLIYLEVRPPYRLMVRFDDGVEGEVPGGVRGRRVHGPVLRLGRATGGGHPGGEALRALPAGDPGVREAPGIGQAAPAGGAASVTPGSELESADQLPALSRAQARK